MKKLIAVFLTLMLCVGLLSACGGNQNADTTNAANPTDNAVNNGKLSIVCTSFPQYDWTREILGDKINDVDMKMLMDSGTDLHSYQPTAGDIISISAADLFIYVGGESDERWVGDSLNNPVNQNRIVIRMMDALGESVYEEETVEGMQAEQENDEQEGEEEVEYDEHIWLSVENAQKLCLVIKNALCSLDAENSAVYTENYNSYNEKLQKLKDDFMSGIQNKTVNTIVVTDRFPFRYLAEEFDINYYAAFAGCSAESEASFDTVITLAGKVDEYGLQYIFTTENPTANIAATVISNTKTQNQQVLTLDSLQTVTAQRVAEGTTYYNVMAQNLQTLQKALNQ